MIQPFTVGDEYKETDMIQPFTVGDEYKENGNN